MGQNHLFRIEEAEGNGGSIGVAKMEGVDLQQAVLTKKANGPKSGRISPQRLHSRFEERGWTCYFSGVILNREDGSLDHLEAISKGGSHSEQNLELVHAIINRMKGTLSETEFVRWCVAVAVHSGGCRLPE